MRIIEGKAKVSPDIFETAKRDYERAGYSSEDFRLPSRVTETLQALLTFASEKKRRKIEDHHEPSSTSQLFEIMEASSSHSSSTSAFVFNEGGPSKNFLQSWQEKILANLKSRFPPIVTINDEEVETSSLSIEISFTDGKYFAACPLCSAVRSISSPKDPAKFNGSNIYHHFSTHKTSTTSDQSTSSASQSSPLLITTEKQQSSHVTQKPVSVITTVSTLILLP